MANCIIHPIPLCQGPRDLSQWTYCMNIGTKSTSVMYVWYIEGSQSKILVDAGGRASTLREGGIPSEEIQSVEAGLGKLGVKPTDIDIIVVTHLHNDHIELGHLYKNARFIIQKKELDYARNPHPWEFSYFDRRYFDDLNLEVIDGDVEIVPGVAVFLTPGHTPGGQSVAINTAKGKAIITGFCCAKETFVQTEQMKLKGREVGVPGLHQDCRVAYDSVLKIKRMADIILPLHDKAFLTGEAIY